MSIARLKQIGSYLFSAVERWWILLLFIAVVCVPFFVFSGVDWTFWAERTFRDGTVFETKLDGLKVIQQLGLFLLAVIGLGLAIWRSLTAQRMADAAFNQSKTAVLQAEIAENNQKFDRYARAAQMLDSEKTAVRQAGIYLLRELALSDALGYRVLCTDLLVGFIKAHIFESLEKVEGTSSKTGMFPIPTREQAKKELAAKETPRDVVDALKSLCRMTAGQTKDVDLGGGVFAKLRLDHHFDLSSFDFSDTIFSQLSGYGAILDEGSFSNSVFRFLTLHQANVRNVSFYGTEFDNADFEDADLTDTSFWDCKFKDCEFRRCDVSGISFLIDGVGADPPFDPDLLKNCWAWENNPPKLGGLKFHGTLYNPGPADKERKGFAERREKRRIQGLNYSEIRPHTKLKVKKS